MKKKRFQLNWISKYRDELYGIAILSVMFFHFAMLHVDFYGSGQKITFKLTNLFYRYYSSGGVDVFALLSGMSLYYSFSKNSDIGSFYIRRFKRILIPYIIVGGIFWIRLDIFQRGESFVRLLKDFFYVTFVTDGASNLWFISFIGAMYLIFPFIYKASFNRRFGKVFYLIILAVAFLIPTVTHMYEPGLYENIDKALARIPIFVIGIMAGKIIKDKKTMPHIAAAVFTLLCFYIRYYAVLNGFKGEIKRYSVSLFSIGVLILCTYLLRLLDRAAILRRILSFFGRYSLEFYLLHILMWELMIEAGIPLHRTSRYALLVIACCILAPLLSKLTTVISQALSLKSFKVDGNP